MWWMLRLLLRVRRPAVTEKDAIRIAEREFHQMGITRLVLLSYEGLRHWKVLAQGDRIGSAWIVVNNQTGIVTKKNKGYPR
jgi:hypothetical protein